MAPRRISGAAPTLRTLVISCTSRSLTPLPQTFPSIIETSRADATGTSSGSRTKWSYLYGLYVIGVPEGVGAFGTR